QILQAVEDGIADPAKAFVDQMTTKEEAPFLGDWSYFNQLQRLGEGSGPLIQNSSGSWVTRGRNGWRLDFVKQKLVLTDAGRNVLAGRADAVALNGIDRWLGGVHLIGREVWWRWDRGQGRVIPGWA